MAIEAKMGEILLGHVYTSEEMGELGFRYLMPFGDGHIYGRSGERCIGDCTDKNALPWKSKFVPTLKYPVKEDQPNAAKS